MPDDLRKLSLKHMLIDMLNKQQIITELDVEVDCLRELANDLERAWKKQIRAEK